jgi:restriction system protein
VIYPSKRDRHIHIGRVTGELRYDANTEPRYPQRRDVEWIRDFPRTKFTQGALYEVGSAMSFFRVRTYTEEFLAALGAKTADAIPTPTAAADESVTIVAEEIEEVTQDFVLKTLAQELKGHPFAEFIAHLLSAMGYRTRVSPPGPDGGIDVIAHKDELGFEPPIVKVQVTSGDGSIGEPEVSALNGKVEAHRGEFGLLVTLGHFSTQAKAFARSKSNLRLIDGDELVSLILAHYEQFDSRYKGLLPLKRVYVPEPIENDADE